MKIAINCFFFQPKGGGIKEYIYNLVSNLALLDNKNDYILYVLSDMYEFAVKSLPQNFKIKAAPFSSQSPIKRSLFEHFYWVKEEKKECFDLFHSPFFHCPKFKHAKTIITVHDLRFCRYPKTYPFKRYIFLKYAVKRAIHKCNHIISISNFTKSEIIKYYGVNQEKISVIWEAINRNDFLYNKNSDVNSCIVSSLENQSFLLSVSHIEPRKNYIRLIDAFKILKMNPQNKGIKLVVVGKRSFDFKKVINKIELDDDIIYLDFVSRTSLIWLYKNAKLFIFPSLYEGFGFPPLEAASLNTISVVSKESCIPEICGEASLYFNPYDIRDIAEKCNIALNDISIRQKLKDQLDINLKRFSWRKNAEDTLRIYQQICN